MIQVYISFVLLFSDAMYATKSSDRDRSKIQQHGQQNVVSGRDSNQYQNNFYVSPRKRTLMSVLPPIFYNEQQLMPRQELDQIRNAFNKDRLAILEGPTGVGKSSLAVQYWKEFNKKKNKIAIWIDAKDEDLIFESYSKLVGFDGSQNEGKQLIDEVHNLVKSSDNVLVIFDGIEDAAVFRKYVPMLIGLANILVTTRNTNLYRLDKSSVHINVEQFSFEVANKDIEQTQSLATSFNLLLLIESLISNETREAILKAPTAYWCGAIDCFVKSTIAGQIAQSLAVTASSIHHTTRFLNPSILLLRILSVFDSIDRTYSIWTRSTPWLAGWNPMAYIHSFVFDRLEMPWPRQNSQDSDWEMAFKQGMHDFTLISTLTNGFISAWLFCRDFIRSFERLFQERPNVHPAKLQTGELTLTTLPEAQVSLAQATSSSTLPASENIITKPWTIESPLGHPSIKVPGCEWKLLGDNVQLGHLDKYNLVGWRHPSVLELRALYEQERQRLVPSVFKGTFWSSDAEARKVTVKNEEYGDAEFTETFRKYFDLTYGRSCEDCDLNQEAGVLVVRSGVLVSTEQ